MVYEFVNDICADMLKAAKHQQDLAARPNEPAPGDTEAPAQDDEAPAEPVGRARVGRGSPDPAQSATEGLPPATPARSAGSEDTFNSDSPPLGTEYSVPSTTQSPPASDSAARVGRGSPDPAQPPTEGLPESTDVSTLDLGPWTLDPASTPSPASLPEAPDLQHAINRTEASTPSTAETSTPPPTVETSPPAPPTSPKNPKREALPLSVPCPLSPVPLSPPPSVSPSPPSAAGGSGVHLPG